MLLQKFCLHFYEENRLNVEEEDTLDRDNLSIEMNKVDMILYDSMILFDSNKPMKYPWDGYIATWSG